MVYVYIPKGSDDVTIKEMVYKLLKAYYDLKQVSQLWYERLSKLLLKRLDLNILILTIVSLSLLHKLMVQ